ncbi:hypothetical protein ACFLZ2_04765 [Candidatus Margulisiibacteriota bacterium]
MNAMDAIGKPPIVIAQADTGLDDLFGDTPAKKETPVKADEKPDTSAPKKTKSKEGSASGASKGAAASKGSTLGLAYRTDILMRQYVLGDKLSILSKDVYDNYSWMNAVSDIGNEENAVWTGRNWSWLTKGILGPAADLGLGYVGTSALYDQIAKSNDWAREDWAKWGMISLGTLFGPWLATRLAPTEVRHIYYTPYETESLPIKNIGMEMGTLNSSGVNLQTLTDFSKGVEGPTLSQLYNREMAANSPDLDKRPFKHSLLFDFTTRTSYDGGILARNYQNVSLQYDAIMMSPYPVLQDWADWIEANPAYNLLHAPLNPLNNFLGFRVRYKNTKDILANPNPNFWTEKGDYVGYDFLWTLKNIQVVKEWMLRYTEDRGWGSLEDLPNFGECRFNEITRKLTVIIPRAGGERWKMPWLNASMYADLISVGERNEEAFAGAAGGVEKTSSGYIPTKGPVQEGYVNQIVRDMSLGVDFEIKTGEKFGTFKLGYEYNSKQVGKRRETRTNKFSLTKPEFGSIWIKGVHEPINFAETNDSPAGYYNEYGLRLKPEPFNEFILGKNAQVYLGLEGSVVHRAGEIAGKPYNETVARLSLVVENLFAKRKKVNYGGRFTAAWETTKTAITKVYSEFAVERDAYIADKAHVYEQHDIDYGHICEKTGAEDSKKAKTKAKDIQDFFIETVEEAKRNVNVLLIEKTVGELQKSYDAKIEEVTKGIPEPERTQFIELMTNGTKEDGNEEIVGFNGLIDRFKAAAKGSIDSNEARASKIEVEKFINGLEAKANELKKKIADRNAALESAAARKVYLTKLYKGWSDSYASEMAKALKIYELHDLTRYSVSWKTDKKKKYDKLVSAYKKLVAPPKKKLSDTDVKNAENAVAQLIDGLTGSANSRSSFVIRDILEKQYNAAMADANRIPGAAETRFKSKMKAKFNTLIASYKRTAKIADFTKTVKDQGINSPASLKKEQAIRDFIKTIPSAIDKAVKDAKAAALAAARKAMEAKLKERIGILVDLFKDAIKEAEQSSLAAIGDNGVSREFVQGRKDLFYGVESGSEIKVKGLLERYKDVAVVHGMDSPEAKEVYSGIAGKFIIKIADHSRGLKERYEILEGKGKKDFKDLVKSMKYDFDYEVIYVSLLLPAEKRLSFKTAAQHEFDSNEKIQGTDFSRTFKSLGDFGEVLAGIGDTIKAFFTKGLTQPEKDAVEACKKLIKEMKYKATKESLSK